MDKISDPIFYNMSSEESILSKNYKKNLNKYTEIFQKFVSSEDFEPVKNELLKTEILALKPISSFPNLNYEDIQRELSRVGDPLPLLGEWDDLIASSLEAPKTNKKELLKTDILALKPISLFPNLIYEDIHRELSNVGDPLPLLREWDQLIEAASLEAPKTKLIELAKSDPKKHQTLLREEWLVKAPLTGLCFGLAIEHIFLMTLHPEKIIKMNPSDVSRYFQKLMLIIADEVMTKYSVELESLKTEQYGDIFNQISLKLFENYGWLARIHQPAHQLLSGILSTLKTSMHSGHSLLILENPNKTVFAQHVVYFNKGQGIIADGYDGLTIKVDPKNFELFFAFFIQQRHYVNYENFSIIEIDQSALAKLPGPSDYAEQNRQLANIATKSAFKGVSNFS